MTLGDKIRNAREAAGLTQEELGKMCGTTKQTIYKYEIGKITNIPIDRLEKIAGIVGVSTASLLGWEESSTPVSSIPSGYSPMPETELRPRVGRIACGEPITAEENIDDYDEVMKSWHADFTLLCCGDSMLPKIQDGDVVAIRAQQTVDNGQIAAVRIGDEATLKRVFLHPDYIELRPLNPYYDSIIRHREEMDDIRIEGIAVGLCRNL